MQIKICNSKITHLGGVMPSRHSVELLTHALGARRHRMAPAAP